MTNLKGFKINSTLDNMMFYVCSLDFNSIKEYIEEVYEGSEQEFKDAIKKELLINNRSDAKIDEVFQTAVVWFKYKKLLTWRGVEDQDIIQEQSTMLIVKDEKCKIWIVTDSEGGGVVIFKDTHVSYDDRDDYSNEYSDKLLEQDSMELFTYKELYEGVNIENGYNVWIGNGDKVLGLKLIFRKV